jgi:hypothetical protein
MIVISKNKPLYASKSYSSTEILKYNKKNVEESKDRCDGRNISWFGDYKVAQSYETKNDHVRQWETLRKIKLISIDKDNENLFNDRFLETKKQLEPLTDVILPKPVYIHPYINTMNTNERCLYEFKFAFGYITVNEQYEFIKLFDFLLEKNYLSLLSRKNDIIPSFKLKMYYYGINFEDKEKLKYQRFSLYHIDKCVLRNVCKLISTRYDGVYQPNQKNFWNPNLLVFETFRKNIEEYILFRPQDVLEPVENIEKYIVDKFIEFFRDELRETVINGGYGIKKILENRYHLFDLIDTKDIDVMVGGCTLDNLSSIMQKWNDKIDIFLKMIGNPNIKKTFKNFKGKFYPQFNYNGYKEITISYIDTDLIDVMFTNYIIKDEILDKTQSKKANLPLKKLEYYLEDLLKLVYQINVDGINHDLYKKRNPIHGTKKDKGKKIMYRAKLICNILENKPKYKNRCSIIKSITDNDLMKSNAEKSELFSTFVD